MSTLSKKICLLGDFAVGKTSLVRRYVHDLFSDKYISTIGVKVSRKTVPIAQTNGVTTINMMLWDLAGSEEFDQIRSSYLRGAAGAVLVCDVTRPETLKNLHNHIDALLNANPAARLILAANKSDLAEQQSLNVSEITKTAANYHMPFYFTSAKTGNEVEVLFGHLGKLLVTEV